MSKLPNFCKPQFPHLQSENKNISFIGSLRGLNENVYKSTLHSDTELAFNTLATIILLLLGGIAFVEILTMNQLYLAIILLRARHCARY